MEIMKVKNYKAFGEILRKKTDCEINIKLMNDKDHVHYQLSKDGISLGVLCMDEGEASFAPFITHADVEDLYDDDGKLFINVQYMPMLNDFISVLKVFDELFVCEEVI